MNPRVAVLITAVMVMLSMLGFTQSATAQASRYTVSDCIESDDGYVYCYEETGVVNAQETPSGRFVGISVTSVTYTLTFNGDVIETGQRRGDFIHVSSGGIAQVDRFNGSQSVTHTDPNTGESTVCTYTFIFVYTNGGIRHEADELVCT